MKPCIITITPLPPRRFAMYSIATRPASSSFDPTNAVGAERVSEFTLMIGMPAAIALSTRRTGLHFARVQNNRVHLLRDEGLHLLHLAFRTALRVVHDQ